MGSEQESVNTCVFAGFLSDRPVVHHATEHCPYALSPLFSGLLSYFSRQNLATITFGTQSLKTCKLPISTGRGRRPVSPSKRSALPLSCPTVSGRSCERQRDSGVPDQCRK